MYRALALGILLGPLVAMPLAAQRSSNGFQPWEPPPHTLESRDAPAVPALHLGRLPRRDYRYEGLFIGGLAFGTLGAVVGHGLSQACPTVPGADCEPDRLGNAVTVGLVGAAVGGGLGFLIGWLSPKPNPVAAADW
jgi:hypothetical protein